MVIENFNYIEQNFIIPSPSDPDFVVKLTQYLRDIAKELRYKQSITQTSSEQIVGQEAGRTIFGRKIDFGALPNAGTKCIPHGITITPTFRWRKIYAIAQKANGDALVLNFSGSGGNAWINIYTSGNNICIQTGTNRSDYTIVTIFLEYIKNI